MLIWRCTNTNWRASLQPRPPEEEIRRAGQAEQILESPIFKEAVKEVEDALLLGMRSTAIVDDKLRLRLLDKYESLHSLVQVLRSTMETGKLAREKLEIEERQKNWMQRVKDKFG